ncbi:MAG: excinuclease ABC subunit UvrA [Candidatus Melainabacteria bacterium]|nr:excinuclease ABC subunit UvrA [Candidatus Melainabacteria bacterium]
MTIKVRGARQNNLKGIDLTLPHNCLVAFTGVSGSGKSSLAFGTIYAEAQRRYFETIAPYARRLLDQLPPPKVQEISGLPPAVALEQRRAEFGSGQRSTVGTLTTLSNLLRMLFSRAGDYPDGLEHYKDKIDSDHFSANTAAGACPTCHGLGLIHTVSEASLVPDPNLSIREKAIAAWPGAWQGKNYRDILATLGYDIDKPWKDLPEHERKWILFTDEQPVVTVYAEREAHRIQRPYQGTYMSAARYVLHTFGTTQSAALRKRAERHMEKSPCNDCRGKKLKADALAIKVAGYDIAELTSLPLRRLPDILQKHLDGDGSRAAKSDKNDSARLQVAKLLVDDLCARLALLQKLGLDYLSLERTTASLSAGELQRLRLTGLLRSGLFGVVYVLDEPSAGLHPADSEALYEMLKSLKEMGNTVFVVEHEMSLVRKSDFLVDIGPGAGDLGGELIYSGSVDGIKAIGTSQTARFLFPSKPSKAKKVERLKPEHWLELSGITRHNLKDLAVSFPLGLFTAVTGVSGSGKSTLVSQILSEVLQKHISSKANSKTSIEADSEEDDDETTELVDVSQVKCAGLQAVKRLVLVDQKPIGRTPRSNLATYTGLFDHVRKLFAATAAAQALGFKAGHFSFNVDGGRCPDCEGEGYVAVELLFLPGVYAPCSHCSGSRYKAETLKVLYEGETIASVLDMTVDAAAKFFASIDSKGGAVLSIRRSLATLQQVGLGYLKLGQPATELSGGEAQRIRLAYELQREEKGGTVYILDEPTTGLHPADVEKLVEQLRVLVDRGSTVIVVEHDMDVISRCDWVIDMGPGAGDNGGRLIAQGCPEDIVKMGSSSGGKTYIYLGEKLAELG